VVFGIEQAGGQSDLFASVAEAEELVAQGIEPQRNFGPGGRVEIRICDVFSDVVRSPVFGLEGFHPAGIRRGGAPVILGQSKRLATAAERCGHVRHIDRQIAHSRERVAEKAEPSTLQAADGRRGREEVRKRRQSTRITQVRRDILERHPATNEHIAEVLGPVQGP